jgi:hypothetical protein
MVAGVKHKAAQYTIGKLGSAFCRVLVDAPPAKTPACVSDVGPDASLTTSVKRVIGKGLYL